MSTPFPSGQTSFPISVGGNSLGNLLLSQQALSISQIPAPRGGGAPPPDNNGNSFPAIFQHLCNQLETDLAQVNRLLFNLNSLWSQSNGDVPSFVSQNQSLFADFAVLLNRFRSSNGFNQSDQMKWPLVPTSGQSSDYCEKTFSFSRGRLTGTVMLVSDQESNNGVVASWNFITNYAVVLRETEPREDPSSSSSYYSTAATYPMSD